MSHGFDLPGAKPSPQMPHAGVLGRLAWLVDRINRVVLVLGMLALLVASLILSAAVFLRYFLHQPTDWQDEIAVFLLVGTTFLCGSYVQEQRGHVGIEALVGLLPPRLNRLRAVLVDLATFLFCCFFTWKSLSLCLEAYNEGQTTSSNWAPPLAIPYGLMTAGMLLLSLQLLVHVLAGCFPREERS